jgi:hypothetical protein
MKKFRENENFRKNNNFREDAIFATFLKLFSRNFGENTGMKTKIFVSTLVQTVQTVTRAVSFCCSRSHSTLRLSSEIFFYIFMMLNVLYVEMPEYRKKVSPASLVLPLVRLVRSASASVRYRWSRINPVVPSYAVVRFTNLFSNKKKSAVLKLRFVE